MGDSGWDASWPARLGRVPALAHLPELGLVLPPSTGKRRGLRGADAWRALFLEGHFPALRWLDLAGQATFGPQGASLLAQRGSASLEVLRLWRTGLTAAGVAALASSPVLQGVRRLHLSGNVIGMKGVEALIAGGVRASLQELGLDRCGLTDRHVARLLSVDWPRLTRLDLRNNAVKHPVEAPPGMELLAETSVG